MDMVLVLSIVNIAILVFIITVLAFLANQIVGSSRNFGSLGAKVDRLDDLTREKLGGISENINTKLATLYQGIGEMHTLASSVGDLKKALSNVKTRGIWGEVQLGRILEQMLAPSQYKQNVNIKPNSREQIEYAICIPTADEGEVLLPIDAKFPIEDYEKLVKAAEEGDGAQVEAYGKELERRILLEAKSIYEKYISPPKTTDYALMFLPTEGLYAEIMRRPGLASTVQQKYHVVITGPITVSAMVNSLQMSFRSYALQKNAREVWQVLGQVKTEFAKHDAVIEKIRKKLHEASEAVEELEKRSRILAGKIKVSEGIDILEDS